MSLAFDFDKMFDGALAITTREQALVIGLPRYFTGKPCKHGHIAEHYTSSRNCVACTDARRLAKQHASKTTGETRYSNGKPCKRGHVAERFKGNGCCVECHAIVNVNYGKNNPDKKEKNRKDWRAANPAATNVLTAKRRAQNKLATPHWLTAEHEKQIKQVYKAAATATKATGIKHVVDHIYPLQGETSRGLHVPWNLQVLPYRWNCSKSNADPIEWIDVEAFEPVDVRANWHTPGWRFLA